MEKSPFARNLGVGEKYGDIRDVIDDCAAGKPIYLHGHVTACDVLMKLTVAAVMEIIARGQLHRCERIF